MNPRIRLSLFARTALFALCGLLLTSASVRGQFGSAAPDKKVRDKAAQKSDDREETTIVRVYNVDDLLYMEHDYPYRPGLPTTKPFEARPSGGGFIGGVMGAPAGVGGGGMGGGMGGGGMGGGGMFSVDNASAAQTVVGSLSADSVAPQSALRRDSLIELLTTLNDGSGNFTIFGNKLIVRQSAKGQEETSAFLQALRSGSIAMHSVTIDATWVLVSPGDLETLRQHSQSNADLRELDANRFREFAKNATVFHSALTCLNGQTVHVTTGRRQVVSHGAVPTVGVGASGYSSVTETVNVGAVLQVTPFLSRDNRPALLNVQSVVTQWNPPVNPIQVTSISLAGTMQDGSNGSAKPAGPLTTASATIDRTNLGTLEWATTASIPTDRPVVVGSATLGDTGNGPLHPRPHSDLALVIELRTH